MTIVMPEKTTRLQGCAVVKEDQLLVFNKEQIIELTCEHLVKAALKKLLKDCVTLEDSATGKDKIVKMDVIVLSPDELSAMLTKAREEGAAR